MSARKSILALHLIGSVGLLGSSSALLLLAIRAASTADAELAHSAYRLMKTEILVFGIPLSFVALLSGIALGLVTNWGVLRYWWTTAKLALIVLTIACGAVLIGPMLDQRLDGRGSEWGLVAAVGANVAMLATAAVLGVFKPGGRLRPARSVPAS
jgi:MFS-type transporter involved in bile tolerance (Atg22 family)